MGQPHVPERRRIEAVRIAVRVAGKNATVAEVITTATSLESYYKDGTLMDGTKSPASIPYTARATGTTPITTGAKTA